MGVRGSKKRAQVSTEYIILIGVVLIALIPAFYYTFAKSGEDVRLNQVTDAVNALAKAADSVYAIGPGTKDYVWITIPSGVQEIIVGAEVESVFSNEINIKISVRGGISDVHATTKANVTGRVPTAPGTYKIPVETIPGVVQNYVQIGAVGDASPPKVLFTAPSGVIYDRYPTLSATTNEDAHCKYSTQSEGDMDYLSMPHHFTGEGLTHTDVVGPLTNGDYTYYVRCRDLAGNTMLSSALIQFTVASTADVDTDNPVVELIAPEDGAEKNYNFIQFIFNVTDRKSGIDLCSLYIYGILSEDVYYGRYEQEINDTSIEEGVPQIIGVVLQKGNWSWNVTCFDDSPQHNKGTSETRKLRVNTTIWETYVDTCEAWCVVHGLPLGGWCDINPNKCGSGCGLNETPDCYAGINASNFCVAGSESDTCCCDATLTLNTCEQQCDSVGMEGGQCIASITVYPNASACGAGCGFDFFSGEPDCLLNGTFSDCPASRDCCCNPPVTITATACYEWCLAQGMVDGGCRSGSSCPATGCGFVWWNRTDTCWAGQILSQLYCGLDRCCCVPPSEEPTSCSEWCIAAGKSGGACRGLASFCPPGCNPSLCVPPNPFDPCRACPADIFCPGQKCCCFNP